MIDFWTHMCYTDKNDLRRRILNIVILDSATLGSDIDLSPIYAKGQVTEYRSTPDTEVAERIKNTDVIVVNKIKLGEHNMKDADSLKLICVTATGYDNIDTAYCKSRGISLYNVPAYSTASVAQITMAMALSLVSHLSEYRDFVNSGEYSASGVANRLTPVYHELSSMTWGVVGGGSIGSEVAKIASAFGCKILICRRKPDKRYECCDMDTLCEKSDIISLHVPLSDETRGMISKERIEKMKNNAILINVARGAVVDEAAVAEAIECGKLGGIGIDVFSKEPFPEDHPYNRLLSKSNVILTPHMAWGSYEARNRCIEVIAKNISSFENNGITNKII